MAAKGTSVMIVVRPNADEREQFYCADPALKLLTSERVRLPALTYRAGVRVAR